MKTVAELQERMADIPAEMQAIIDAAEDGVLSEEQQAEFDALKDESATIEKQVENLQAAEKAAAQAKTVRQKVKVGVNVINEPEDKTAEADKLVIPATVHRYGALKAFGKNEEQAYRFGKWVLAANGNQAAREWCGEHGITMAVHNEGSNTAGGYLVPPEFDNTIIDLSLNYGVFRRNAKIVPMSRDTKSQPRRTSGLTAYWIGENSAITESDKAWDQVSLTAKKLAVLTRMSNELSEDAVINIGDDLADEIGRAFAYAEDTAGFNGTGISTHGGITGVNTALKAAAGPCTTTSAGGVIVSANNTMLDFTLGEHERVLGLCPTYARAGAKWYCSPLYFDTVMSRLIHAAGGSTQAELQGVVTNRFLGYPVELSESFPTSDVNSQIYCIFGNLAMAASFGDRRQKTIAFDSSLYFAYDQIAVRGTERLDIVVHDVGTSSVAGPIVGLQGYNS